MHRTVLESELLHSYAMITVVLLEVIVLVSVVLLVSESQKWAQLVRNYRGTSCPDKYPEPAALRVRNRRGRSGTKKCRVDQITVVTKPS